MVPLLLTIIASFQLSQTPDKNIVLQSLGALLNMTVSEVMREEVGRKGAVTVAMGI